MTGRLASFKRIAQDDLTISRPDSRALLVAHASARFRHPAAQISSKGEARAPAPVAASASKSKSKRDRCAADCCFSSSRAQYQLAVCFGPLLDRVVQALVVAPDSASHERAKEWRKQAADIFDVREENGPVRLRLDQELAVAGEESLRTDGAFSRYWLEIVDLPPQSDGRP